MLDERTRKLAEKIKEGTLVWEDPPGAGGVTFEHPIYGPLTFKARLPVGAALQAHTVAIGNELDGAIAEPTMGAVRLAVAYAAVGTLIEPPVIDELRTDSEDGASERIEKVYYDPHDDPLGDWVVKVWEAFSQWRDGLLSPEGLEALKNSSGETRGTGSSESSDEPTGSPSPTLA